MPLRLSTLQSTVCKLLRSILQKQANVALRADAINPILQTETEAHRSELTCQGQHLTMRLLTPWSLHATIMLFQLIINRLRAEAMRREEGEGGGRECEVKGKIKGKRGQLLWSVPDR